MYSPCVSARAPAEVVWFVATATSAMANGALIATPIKTIAPMVLFMFISNLVPKIKYGWARQLDHQAGLAVDCFLFADKPFRQNRAMAT